jgi:hypothetical protein
MPLNSLRDRGRHRRRHRISYLAELVQAKSVESEAVGESLQTCGLTNRDGTVIDRMDIAAPVGIAFGEDRAAEPGLAQPTVPFRMVARTGASHSRREEFAWNVSPVPTWRYVLHPLQVVSEEEWRHVIE